MARKLCDMLGTQFWARSGKCGNRIIVTQCDVYIYIYIYIFFFFSAAREYPGIPAIAKHHVPRSLDYRSVHGAPIISLLNAGLLNAGGNHANHPSLRTDTNQATKASLAKLPLP